MTIRFAFCLLAGVLVLNIPASAQNKNPTPKHKEFCTQHKQWAHDNVLPVLQQWKQELDAILTPEDLEQLNTLRGKAAELRAQKNNIRTALHALEENGDETTREELREQLRELREQLRELAMDLRPLIEEYRDELRALHKQHRPTLEAWKQERKQQWKDWLEKQQQASDAEEVEQERPRHPRCMPRHGGKKHSLVHFLLWDGSLPTDQESTAPSAPTNGYRKPNAEQEALAPSLVQLSPNPAATHITLQFSLPTAGATTLTLYNTQGSVVTPPLQQQYFQAGIHSVEIATQTLAPGAYQYILENNGHVLAGTLYVNR